MMDVSQSQKCGASKWKRTRKTAVKRRLFDMSRRRLAVHCAADTQSVFIGPIIRDVNETWTHETETETRTRDLDWCLVTVVAKGHSSSRRTGRAIFYFHKTQTAQLKQRSQVYEYGRNMLIDCMLRALEVSWLYVTLIVVVFIIFIIIIIIIIIIRMIERFICYFKTRGDRRATKGDKRGRPSIDRV